MEYRRVERGMLVLLAACSPPTIQPASSSHIPAVGENGGMGAARHEVRGEPYAQVRARIASARERLASLPRSEARRRGRVRLLVAFRDELVPYWLGTDWAFYGTTQTPGEGTIACGYFVSTLLEHAGLGVERVTMAQQPSEYIVKTFADEPDIARFRGGDRSGVVDWVRANDDGVYAVGFDYHVGTLVKRGDEVEFCHSAYTGPVEVVCSDPLGDPGFISDYHVVGPVLTDRIVDAWLDGESVETYTP